MGVLPASDSYRPAALPDTPPGLASPSASSFSSRSSPATESAWGTRSHASLPMSKYEKGSADDMTSTETAAEAPQSRPEAPAPAAPRQQLPSLSSLFGPPSAVRPLNSPMSDRPASYPSQSPLDRPRLASGSSHPSSYFPSVPSPSVSQPRSTFDVKFEPERQSLHSLARSFSGPGSPRYRDVNLSRPQSRSDADMAGKWSIHHESSKHEYSLGSRDPSFRSPRDKFRPQFPGPKDSATDYSDQRLNPPPTPTSTIVSDGLLTKDGLGPKIWTGTHFLPRFVRAAEVPGEGLCYFYDDGTHCKTVIDGEAVNAHWGVTKAGKPRKRLAIACVTCREKKIKCDPDYPRCVQCEKFGRLCKFKNAPRGGHNTSPSTPPAELDDMRRMGGSLRPGEIRFSGSDCSSPASPRATLRQASPPDASYNKRLKLGPDSYAANGEPSAMAPRSMDHSKSQLVMPRPAPEMPRIPDDVLSRAWRTDPYVSDPQSIGAVVSQFFAHVDSTMILRFLPEDSFKAWLASSVHRKSSEDLMLLYSMLAVGVMLSGGPKQIAFEYAQVAHYAQKITNVNCLQLVQSRILLAVYYVSASRLLEASEVISSAAAVAACMQLGVEFDRSREADLSVYPFSMMKAGYCEARRRTLWSLFMLERLNGLFPDRPTMVCPEDIYARLPADLQSFEQQIEAHMPAFDPHRPSFSKLAEQPFKTAGYLVEIVHLWSMCQSAIYRLVHRPSLSETGAGRLHDLVQRLHEWHSSLPSRMTFGGANLEAASFTGSLGSFLTMHLLYHHAMMKLNRHYYLGSRLSVESQTSHRQKCCDHATSILDIVNSLDRILRVRPAILNTPPFAISMAVTEAVDILTASGPIACLGSLIDNVRVVKTLLDSMSNVWEDSREPRIAVDQRLQMLHRIHERGSRPASPVEGYRVVMSSEESQDRKHIRWQISEPMEKLYPKQMDVVYFALE